MAGRVRIHWQNHIKEQFGKLRGLEVGCIVRPQVDPYHSVAWTQEVHVSRARSSFLGEGTRSAVQFCFLQFVRDPRWTWLSQVQHLASYAAPLIATTSHPGGRREKGSVEVWAGLQAPARKLHTSFLITLYWWHFSQMVTSEKKPGNTMLSRAVMSRPNSIKMTEEKKRFG